MHSRHDVDRLEARLDELQRIEKSIDVVAKRTVTPAAAIVSKAGADIV